MLRKRPRAGRKAAAAAGISDGGDGAAATAGNTETVEATQAHKFSHRTCTGELAMAEGAKDIKVISFSLSFHGENLIEDTTLELNYGRRYGLIGRNGCGKSTFLEALAYGDLELPPHIDKYLLNKEAEPSDMDALTAVIDYVRKEVARLNKDEERIMEEEGPESDKLQPIYDKLDTLDESTFESRASELLWGLGFNKMMMARATKDMSGGWRMRVALARALFVKPTLLLMDEPTNHLDLEACVWLEQYLATYPSILLMVSHSQDFLNGVCTNIMHLTPTCKLENYRGNFTTYVKTKAENEVVQMAAYKAEQEEIKHIKRFIASCGTFSNAVRQAQSRQKILDKMYERGLTPKVEKERGVNLHFPACEKLPPPVLAFEQVSFSYDGDPSSPLLKGMEFGIDCDSRIVLVGPNGAGKSTLLKLIDAELSATTGEIRRHSHLSIARYNQHSEEILNMDMTPLDWIAKEFPVPKVEPTEWRKRLGRYGVTGKQQVRPIGTLSDGQRTQIVFCWLGQQNPNMLLFDEPTNHLDMESIDALGKAINDFPGGMVLVSHDFRLLQLTARSIWIVEKGSVTPWKGDIASYKKHLIDNFKSFDESSGGKAGGKLAAAASSAREGTCDSNEAAAAKAADTGGWPTKEEVAAEKARKALEEEGGAAAESPEAEAAEAKAAEAKAAEAKAAAAAEAKAFMEEAEAAKAERRRKRLEAQEAEEAERLAAEKTAQERKEKVAAEAAAAKAAAEAEAAAKAAAAPTRLDAAKTMAGWIKSNYGADACPPAKIGAFFGVFPWAKPFIMAQPPTQFCNEFSDLLLWDGSPGGGVKAV